MLTVVCRADGDDAIGVNYKNFTPVYLGLCELSSGGNEDDLNNSSLAFWIYLKKNKVKF